MNRLLSEVARAARRLADAGVPSPRADAEELAASVHGVSRGALHAVADRDFDACFWAAVARREAREPLQYITGRAYFRYLELAVGPGVFVPRPETEVVVDWAVGTLHAMDVVQPLVADLGAGSGAIALSVAQEVPLSRVYAVEIDDKAYGWAEHNIAGHEAGVRVRLMHADMAGALHELEGLVDLVISNPPYVPVAEAENVAPEVRGYDPPGALWAGDDGLEGVRLVARAARRLLRPDGFVAVEHADRRGLQAAPVFPESHGWGDVVNRRDLTDRDRFVTARRVAH